MKKLKSKIIHLLGGVTREENNDCTTSVRRSTEVQMVTQMRTYLDLMNGMDPDTWCKCAYEYIARLEKEKSGK